MPLILNQDLLDPQKFAESQGIVLEGNKASNQLDVSGDPFSDINLGANAPDVSDAMIESAIEASVSDYRKGPGTVGEAGMVKRRRSGAGAYFPQTDEMGLPKTDEDAVAMQKMQEEQKQAALSDSGLPTHVAGPLIGGLLEAPFGGGVYNKLFFGNPDEQAGAIHALGEDGAFWVSMGFVAPVVEGAKPLVKTATGKIKKALGAYYESRPLVKQGSEWAFDAGKGIVRQPNRDPWHIRTAQIANKADDALDYEDRAILAAMGAQRGEILNSGVPVTDLIQIIKKDMGIKPDPSLEGISAVDLRAYFNRQPNQTLISRDSVKLWLKDNNLLRPLAESAESLSWDYQKTMKIIIDSPAWEKLSIFDKIRVASFVERPKRKKVYKAEKSVGTNMKMKPYEDEYGNIHESNIKDIDTFRGCENECFNCYALKSSDPRTAYVEVPHELTGKFHDGFLYRNGVVGDPSADWAHTVKQIRETIDRSKKTAPNFDPGRDLFFITKLQKIKGFDPDIVKNMEVSMDPLFPAHMATTMQNVLAIKRMYPDTNIILRIRSFASKNKDLQASLDNAVQFAKETGLPVLETWMRFRGDMDASIMELDMGQYYRKNLINTKTGEPTSLKSQLQMNGPVLDDRIPKEQLLHCNKAKIGVGACALCGNCRKFIADRVGSKVVNPKVFEKEQPGVSLGMYIGEGSASFNKQKVWHRNGSLFDEQSFEYPEGAFSALHDRKTRLEISDYDAEITIPRIQSLSGDGRIYDDLANYSRLVGTNRFRLPEILRHGKLYAEYPWLKDTTLIFNPKIKARGYFDPTTNEIVVGDLPEYQLRKTILHEVQHWIQAQEGFAGGGGFHEAQDYLADLWRHYRDQRDTLEMTLGVRRRLQVAMSTTGKVDYDKVIRDLIDTEAERHGNGDRLKENLFGMTRKEWITLEPKKIQAEMQDTVERMARIEKIQAGGREYLNLAGEVEARDTAHRSNYKKAGREKHAPYSSQKVPTDEMIVRDAHGGKTLKTGSPSLDATLPDSARPTLYLADLEGMDEGARPLRRVTLGNGEKILLKKKDGNIFAVNEDGQVLGYAMSLGDGSTDLAVAKEAQRKGIGTEILREYRKSNPVTDAESYTVAGLKTEKRASRMEDAGTPSPPNGNPAPEIQGNLLAPETHSNPTGNVPGGKPDIPVHETLRVGETREVIQNIIQDGLIRKTTPVVRDPDKRVFLNIAESIAQHPEYAKEILDRYNITADQFAEMLKQSATHAGRTLKEYSDYAKALKKAFPDALVQDVPDTKAIDNLWGWVRRIDNLRRASLTGQLATFIRNLESQGARYSVEFFDQALIGTGRLMAGEEPKLAYARAFETVASVVRSMTPEGRQRLMKILDDYPTKKADLLGGPVQDIIMGSKYVKAITYLNGLQEHWFRRMAFDAYLTAECKRAGINLAAGDHIPDKILRGAINHALEITFQKMPDAKPLADMVKFVASNPILTTIQPFPRFYYNSMRFMWDYNPTGLLSAGYRALVAKDKEGAIKAMSRASTGLMMLGMADAVAQKYQGEKWYELNVGENRYVDVRPFAPFSLYLFLSTAMRNPEKIKPKDWASIALSVNRIGGTGLAFIDMLRAQDPSSAKKMITEFSGQWLGGFTVPIKTAKDLLGENKLLYTREDPFLGPTLSNLPVAGEKYLPESETILRAEPRKLENPQVRQLTGMSVRTKTPLEKEVDRLGIENINPKTGDPELDRLIAGKAGDYVEKFVTPLLEKPGYKNADDEVKKFLLNKAIGTMRNEFKKNMIVPFLQDKLKKLENEEARFEYLKTWVEKGRLGNDGFKALMNASPYLMSRESWQKLGKTQAVR